MRLCCLQCGQPHCNVHLWFPFHLIITRGPILHTKSQGGDFRLKDAFQGGF